MAFRSLFAGVVAALCLPALASAADVTSLRGFSSFGQVFLPLYAATGAIVHRDGEGLKQFAASGAATILLTEGLKRTVDASRPNGKGNDAFPSGHAATAFWAAAYVHYRYGWQWGLPFEAAAAAVGYSRVQLNEHRWRDVIGGAVLAHAIAFLAVDAQNDSVIVIPVIGGKKNEFGLLVKIGF